MTTYITPAAQIRKALKKNLGLTSRQVSVRGPHGSVTVTIKAPGINRQAVRNVAEEFQRIRRDERSGDILCGGNTFVSVTMAHDVYADHAAKVAPWVDSVPREGTFTVPGVEALGVSRDIGNPHLMTLWNHENDGEFLASGGPQQIADEIGRFCAENA